MASQYGQDQLVVDILHGQRGGYFLDSGASDGIGASNTWLLEKHYDWTGLCVEPNPMFFNALVKNRDCRCENVCFHTENTEVSFVNAGTLGGVLDYYPDYELARLAAMGRSAEIVQRPARTIRKVLADAGAPQIIDYWSLDVEGSELALLRSFPFDRHTFRILTVEHNNHPVVQESIRAFLQPYGFERLCTIMIDDCYVNTRLGMQASPSRTSSYRRSRSS